MANKEPTASRFAWLKETELRLWHMIVAAIFTTFVTTVVPIYVDRENREVDRFAERSQELVNVSVDFENSVNRLVNSGSSFDEFKPEDRLALMQNVEAQIRALNKITPILSEGEQRELADEYSEVLIEVRNMLQNGLSAEETKSFGIAAQHLVLTRNSFLAILS